VNKAAIQQAEAEKNAQEAAMIAHLANTVNEVSLAEGATEAVANVASLKALVEARGGSHLASIKA
jgi:hypothetical protein